MAEPIRAPDGRTWTVRRRWVPRLSEETLWGRFRRRFRQTLRRTADVADLDTGCGEAVFEGLVIAVVALVVIFVGFPLLVALLDLVLVLLLAALGIVARVLFRRPWIIEARSADGALRTWRVTGWDASRQRRDEIEHRLRFGLDPDA